jgi:hypothetical protein
VREVFADDVAAGGAEDVADEEDIHSKSLHGVMRAAARWHGKVQRQIRNGKVRRGICCWVC